MPVNTGLVPHPHPSASRRNKVEETKSAPKSKKSAADKKIPYRYIQKVAVSLNLPGNLKVCRLFLTVSILLSHPCLSVSEFEQVSYFQ